MTNKKPLSIWSKSICAKITPNV